VGDVRGVLEFVNRQPAREHPFELFDEHEQRVAWDVARAIAGLIDHQEHHRAIEALRKQLTPAVQMGAKALANAMVMHQLMTPFARMQASVAWLMSYPGAPIEKRMEYLHRIESFCSDAVRRIRQTARAGRPDLHVEDLRTVVQRAVTIVRTEAPADIRFDVANEASVPVHVEVDSIVGAVVHLLANALDAMEGGGTLTVSTAEAADGTKALLRIRNTGPHYTEEEVARFGVPGYTMKHGGEHLGFGVPLARQAVEMFGGALAMEPHPDGGVETTITLPRADRRHGQQ
jgi:signal transduction histidine kinase